MNDQCYVHIVLPGEVKSVTASKFVLTADRHSIPFGNFVYGQSYLARANAVAIDPVELKLTTDTFETRQFDGIFGAL